MRKWTNIWNKWLVHCRFLINNFFYIKMTVFKYIEDKDMFQAFFHKMLCKRLVTEASASEEAERFFCLIFIYVNFRSMIAKLKHMCGFEYTNKLERLLTDVTLSRDNSDIFRRVFYLLQIF